MNKYQSLIQYHHQKEKREIMESRIIGSFLIICLFIIMPLLSHYL